MRPQPFGKKMPRISSVQQAQHSNAIQRAIISIAKFAQSKDLKMPDCTRMAVAFKMEMPRIKGHYSRCLQKGWIVLNDDRKVIHVQNHPSVQQTEASSAL
jgi:hypothetical protein